MERDDVRRAQLAENLRFYGEMRFKQLTLLMAVMTLVGAAVVQGGNKMLTDRISVNTAAASLALLFTAVMWVMEIRAVLHWNVLREAVPDLWPRPRNGWPIFSATAAVMMLYVGLYGSWLYCAAAWRLVGGLLVAFVLLGIVLIAFSLWAYLQPTNGGRPGPSPKPIQPPRDLPPADPRVPAVWPKIGEPEVMAQGFGKKLVRQGFINPVTQGEEKFVLFGQRDWAVILPVTSANEVIAVRQFKQGCNCLVLELPAGTADSSSEPPEAVANRELFEETGYEARKLEVLGPPQFIATRSSWTRFHCFLATNCEKRGVPRNHESEQLVRELIPLEQWIELCHNEIVEPSAIVATFRAMPKLCPSATAQVARQRD